MNARERLLEEYDVYPETDIICSPGKFEGKCLHVPYFWNMDGEDTIVSDDDMDIRMWYITAEDRAIFPELNDIRTISLYETNDGFIWSSWT